MGQGRCQPSAGALPEPQCRRAGGAGGELRRRGRAAAMTRPALDLLDGSSYVEGAYERYDWFRANEPVAWDDVNELWGVFRYADVEHVETHDDVFISSDTTKGGYRPNIPADPALLGTDNPLHAKRRKLVSRQFTPRAVAAHEPEVRAIVTELLDAALSRGSVEIVGELASVLPARMIGRLLGFPDDAWPRLRDWSEQTIMLGGGPRYLDHAGVAAAHEFMQVALALYEEKRQCPAADVMTLWTRGQIDERPISPREVASDCLALLDGGAETTRTVIARTMLELIARPDQWQLLCDGADMAGAGGGVICWGSPIPNKWRGAGPGLEPGGVPGE